MLHVCVAQESKMYWRQRFIAYLLSMYRDISFLYDGQVDGDDDDIAREDSVSDFYNIVSFFYYIVSCAVGISTVYTSHSCS